MMYAADVLEAHYVLTILRASGINTNREHTRAATSVSRNHSEFDSGGVSNLMT
jgi:hypothetical protein